MKKMIKNLTIDEITNICKKHECYSCPLSFRVEEHALCLVRKDVKKRYNKKVVLENDK